MRFVEAVAGLHTGRFTRIRCQGVSYGNYGGRLAGSQVASEDPLTRATMVGALLSGIPALQARAMACCIDPVLMCSDDWAGDEPEDDEGDEPGCDECYPEPSDDEAELDDEADEDPGPHPFKVGDVVELTRADRILEDHGYHQGDKLTVRYADTVFGEHYVGFHNDERGEWFTSHFKHA